eukprot:TRINITY_DN3220_c0_g1_i4.p1 TRINITY_DN3220_c0_g1~~TRINITY_DN3220_c0_g1_i4.p1  ORF type:complete len:231 (+),score=42.26 TRINITY_DN3220_c0_g1_i4:291-983(+)
MRERCQEQSRGESYWNVSSSHESVQSLKWYCRNEVVRSGIEVNPVLLPPDLLEYINEIRATQCFECNGVAVQYMNPTESAVYFDKPLSDDTILRFIEIPEASKEFLYERLSFLMSDVRAMILVYDISSRSSWSYLQECLDKMRKIQENVQYLDGAHVLLIGNKTDLIPQIMEVEEQEMVVDLEKKGLKVTLVKCSTREPQFRSDFIFQEFCKCIIPPQPANSGRWRCTIL